MGQQEKFSPKLVIYGTGFVGQVLTKLAQIKGWEIVAAYNRAGDKIGQDLGRLAGLDRDLGVVVQDCETANYDEIEADVVLNATGDIIEQNLPIYERFLTRSINVLCHAGQFYNPWLVNRDLSEKIDALARKYDATITGSGIHDMTRYWSGFIAAGPCVEIDAVHSYSYVEPMRQGMHQGPLLGFDTSVEEYNSRVVPVLSPYCEMLSIPMHTVLQFYGCTVTKVDWRIEPVIWDEPAYCPYHKKEIAAGRAVGTRWAIDFDTAEGVAGIFRAEHRVFREGDEEAIVWRIEGQPGVEIKVVREDSAIASASSLFNRIPDVINAEPGLWTLMQLGPEKPSAFL